MIYDNLTLQCMDLSLPDQHYPSSLLPCTLTSSIQSPQVPMLVAAICEELLNDKAACPLQKHLIFELD